LTQNSFSKILLSAVEEGLLSLGKSPKESILFHLEDSFRIKKQNIPKNLPEFKNALEGLFGPGAPYIEKTIARRLHEKLGLEFEDSQSMDFLECVNDARKRITL
jgi:hypothetical protein